VREALLEKQQLNPLFSKQDMEKLRLTALVNDTMAKVYRVFQALNNEKLDKEKCQLNLIMAIQNLLKLSKKLKLEPETRKKISMAELQKQLYALKQALGEK
ncbi:MAG: hypothetical protein RMJ15_04840, partial [Nitrososphaerota archaeon]|nr:hypothetical protein [Nitrososphaerota archaeon]